MKRPSGIDERTDQFRQPIIKTDGVTESERYLAQLADKSFLNLWSYPSPYRDQKINGTGDGKELCDLLVVCGKHIIIFSEKTIKWAKGDVQLAWQRWSRKALQESAKQAKGAERWITEFPKLVFLDKSCTVPFPIDFPEPEERVFHRVIVASGSSDACKRYFGEGIGTLLINPSLRGQDHWPKNYEDNSPFSIGDLDPGGSFIHIFDQVSIGIILGELDTISDFTDYLLKREKFIRSEHLKIAYGEKNLLAYYAIRVNVDGDHDFVPDNNGYPIVIDRGHYQRLIRDPRYIAKKKADKVSYFWDMLIKAFTDNMLNGTSISLDGRDFNISESEIAVRFMALQRRFFRRAYGEAVKGALELGMHQDRFFRVIYNPTGSKDDETAFFIQTLKYMDWMEREGGYEKYRLKRTECARVYAKGLLLRYPHLKRVIGISREPPQQGRGISEDLLYAEQAEWSEKDKESILNDCKAYGVLQGELQEKRWDGDEFPEVVTVAFQDSPAPINSNGMNRKQRRAMKAHKRKNK